MSNAVDQVQVKELFDIVQAQKAEISKAEKPNWITNCSFSFDRTSSNRINIRTLSNVDDIVHILAFLIGTERDFNEAIKELGVDTKFEWLGFSKDDWANDLKMRTTQILLVKKKQKLEIAEARLNKLVSKEVREQMELAELVKELKG